MDDADKQATVEKVTARMVARHPDAPITLIAKVVAEKYDQLASSRIRKGHAGAIDACPLRESLAVGAKPRPHGPVHLGSGISVALARHSRPSVCR
jgi:hypothetical protein